MSIQCRFDDFDIDVDSIILLGFKLLIYIHRIYYIFKIQFWFIENEIYLSNNQSNVSKIEELWNNLDTKD